MEEEIDDGGVLEDEDDGIDASSEDGSSGGDDDSSSDDDDNDDDIDDKAIKIPIQDSDEFVVFYTYELPDDVEEVLELLRVFTIVCHTCIECEFEPLQLA